MSLIPEKFMLLAFNGYESSSAAGVAFLTLLQDVGTALWNSQRLVEPNRRRVAVALRDIEPAYRAFSEFLQELPIGDDERERLHFRLIKLMDDIAVVGASSALTPAGRQLAKGLQGMDANDVKVGNAEIKNRKIQQAIRDVVAKTNIELAVSEECAMRLLPDVCLLCGVPQNAKGYSWSTIRKQIHTVLKERDGSLIEVPSS